MVHEIKKELVVVVCFFWGGFRTVTSGGACMGKEDVLEDGCKM